MAIQDDFLVTRRDGSHTMPSLNVAVRDGQLDYMYRNIIIRYKVYTFSVASTWLVHWTSACMTISLSLGLDTNCFQIYLNFLLAFLKIFPIFPTNLPKFLKHLFPKSVWL